MAKNIVDFSGVPEYKVNNLCLMSLGHISQKAIQPIWPGMPMAGTANQYAPLGYVASNGLGEKMMYCKFEPDATWESIEPADLTLNGQLAVYIEIPELTMPDKPYTFFPIGYDGTESGVIFYAPWDAQRVYGWVKLNPLSVNSASMTREGK